MMFYLFSELNLVGAKSIVGHMHISLLPIGSYFWGILYLHLQFFFSFEDFLSFRIGYQTYVERVLENLKNCWLCEN